VPANFFVCGRKESGRRRARNIVIVVAGAYWYSMPLYPWLFQGAYSTYSGNTTILFVPVQIEVRLQVMDYNTTHAKLFTLLRLSALGTTTENSTTAWFSFRDKNFVWPSATFNQTYEGDYYVEGYGVRHCYVAENVGTGLKGLLYIDSQTLWPLKLRLEMQPAFGLDLNLVETNIPGLK
jgi:hypothetical protein